MQKIINRVLILILLSLIILTVYKITKTPVPVSVSASTSVTDTNNNSEIYPKERIEETVREYLINNPQVIIEAIERLQKQKKAENEDKVNDYLFQNKEEFEKNAQAPWIGNENADITVIAFYDYGCSYCRTGDNYLHQLIETDKNVKVIFQPMPVLGSNSVFAAKVALSIYKLFPEKFTIFHDNLMHAKPLSQEKIIEAVNEAELDYKVIAEEMDKGEIQDILTKNSEISRNLKISGVPAYIIDGKLIPGLMNLNQFQQIISLARLKKLPKE